MNSELQTIFQPLNDWRHLPKYMLEPRVDVFFSLYLPKVLPKVLASIEAGLNDLEVIPEFPLCKKVLNEKLSENLDSYNVDFAVFSKKVKTCILVELKTDMDSLALVSPPDEIEKIKESQIYRLRKAACEGLDKIVYGIAQIARVTKQDKKYGYLVKRLEDLELIESSDEYKQLLYAEHRRGLTDEKETLRASASAEDWKILTAIILPRSDKNSKIRSIESDITIIDFDHFIASMGESTTDLDQLFKSCLSEWKTNPANASPWN